MGFENRFRHGACRLGYRLRRDMEVPLCSGDQWRRRLFLIFVLFTILLGYPLLVGEFILEDGTRRMPLMHIKRSAENSLVSYRMDRRGRMFLSAVVLQCNRRMDFAIYSENSVRITVRAYQAQYGALLLLLFKILCRHSRLSLFLWC